jgi:phosphohistidine phosphatase
LDILRAIPPGAGRVMMVGHNPEIQAFALDLVGAGPKHLRARLAEKFPTAGLAVITFSAGLWSSVEVNSGSLSVFLAPKELRAS